MRRSLLLSFALMFLCVGILASPLTVAAQSTVNLTRQKQEVVQSPRYATLYAHVVANGRDFFVVDVWGNGYGRHQMVGLAVKHNGQPQYIRPWYTRANERGAIYARIYVHSRIHHAWFRSEAYSRHGTGHAYVYRP